MDVAGDALTSFYEFCICLRVVPPKLPRFYPPYHKGFPNVPAPSAQEDPKEWRLQEFVYRSVCLA